MSEIKRVQFTTISTHTSQNFVGDNNANGGVNATTEIPSGITGGNKINQKLQIEKFSKIENSLELNVGSSVGNKSVNNNNSNSNNNNNSGSTNNTTVSGKNNKTFRYDLSLFEPDSESFPEFNFAKLMHIEKKKQRKLKQIQTNGIPNDPFEENDDDVARIAKEMEMKYGNSYVKGRRKNKYDDICDKGLGYDESDSFIDNTEAYDELIPDEVETIAGGFYINSGQLEFKKLTKFEIETEEIVKTVKSRKRVLSSSESESEEENDAVDVNAEIDTEDKSNKKQKEFDEEKTKNGHRDKKQKSSGEDSSSSKSKIKPSKKLKDDFKDSNSKSGDDGTNSDTSKGKPLKTTTVKDMLKAKRDNYLKMQDDKKSLQNGNIKSGNDSSESSGDNSDSDAGPSKKKYKVADEEASEKLRNSDTKLPEDLSEELLREIRELVDTAKLTIKNGKKFRFDDKSTETFLKCDDFVSCLDKEKRNQIYAHLEYQMQLPKQYLMKKGKQIRIKQEKSKIKKAYVKLKEAIQSVMPSVVNSYDATYKQVSDLRAKATTPAEQEKSDPSLKFPRKKFPWNDAMRNLLFDLYQTRWTSYTVLRSRKEKFEDFVNSYLREKVVPIWPVGWMKLEELQKELEKRKNQAKKSKDYKKQMVTSNPSLNDPAITSGVSNIKETSATTLIPALKMKTNDDLSTIINQTPHLSSVTISSSPTAHSKPNYANEVPQKLPENSISIIPVVQESSSNKSHKSLNSINNNVSIDKVPSSVSSNKAEKMDCLTVDIISPSKRTDHSINNIISNTSPTLSTSPISTNPNSRSNSNASSTTHVINVDDFKNTTDIIRTSNKILNNNNNNNDKISQNSNSKKKEAKSKKHRDRDSNMKSKAASKESNSGIKVESISNRRDTIESISSSSDSVEFVEEKFPALPSPAIVDKKNVTVNKNKYIKIKSDNRSRSASPVAFSSNKNKDNIKEKKSKDNIVINEGGGGGGSTSEPPPPPSVPRPSQLLPPLLSGTNENDNLMMRNMNSNSNFSKNNFTETTDAMSRNENETNSESGSENKDSDVDLKEMETKDFGDMPKLDNKAFSKDMKNQ